MGREHPLNVHRPSAVAQGRRSAQQQMRPPTLPSHIAQRPRSAPPAGQVEPEEGTRPRPDNPVIAVARNLRQAGWLDAREHDGIREWLRERSDHNTRRPQSPRSEGDGIAAS